MHLAQSRPQLQGSLHGLFSQHPLPNELAKQWSMAAPSCSGGSPRLARQGRLHSSSKWLPTCIHTHTQIYSANNPLQSFFFFFLVATHSAGVGRICTAGSKAVGLQFSLSPPPSFSPPSFFLTLFFGTLTFQLQAKQPLLFFSWFSRITSSETLWHFKNKSVYLRYLYKPPPLTPGFLFGLTTRLPRVWWYPPLAPTSSSCFVAKRWCLVMFELHRGSLLQKGLSRSQDGYSTLWILDIELEWLQISIYKCLECN